MIGKSFITDMHFVSIIAKRALILFPFTGDGNHLTIFDKLNKH